MKDEDIVELILADESCRKSDAMFLLQCWRKQGANAYIRYTDLPLMSEPKKLLELKELALREGDKHPEESKPVAEEKKSVKATPKKETKPKKEKFMPVGSKIKE